jgi:Fur family transcriptional regulator, ferric uptake regulator
VDEADRRRLDHFLDLLRDSGGRVTTARRAVLTVLLEADGHLHAEELAATVQERHPDVHLSTIYRALETFEELGVVAHVHLGHGPSTYHLSEELHHHAVCETCGMVLELPGDLLADVAAQLERDYGFRMDAPHFALAGRCADCVREL